MSNDCRTKCRNCNHFVDLVAGECPLCDEVYYVDSDEQPIGKSNEMKVNMDVPIERTYFTIEVKHGEITVTATSQDGF